MSTDSLKRIVGVVRGDCSGTELLLEALEESGVEVVPFSYPYPPERKDLKREIERLCSHLGVTIDEAEEWRLRLSSTRESLREVDRLCWSENRVTGLEEHRWLVSSSDFGGQPDRFKLELDRFIEDARKREPLDRRKGIPYSREIRLGYIGVPPIVAGIYDFVERLGARFVYLEVQRQFAMLDEARSITDQYLAYTYPYTVAKRAIDINRESGSRRLDGIVHYVQSFCHRNMEDVVFLKKLKLPVLTVECDGPGFLPAPIESRLESFVQVLGENL